MSRWVRRVRPRWCSGSARKPAARRRCRVTPRLGLARSLFEPVVPWHGQIGRAVRLLGPGPRLSERATTRADFGRIRVSEYTEPRWLQRTTIIQSRPRENRGRLLAHIEPGTWTPEALIRGRRFSGDERVHVGVSAAATRLDIDPDRTSQHLDLIDGCGRHAKRRKCGISAHSAFIAAGGDTRPCYNSTGGASGSDSATSG